MSLQTLVRFIPLGTFLFVMLAACQEGKSAFDLEVGDCIVPPELAQGEVMTVERVRTVDCSEAHDGEVIAVFNLKWELRAAYPGEEAILREAEQGCPPKASLVLYPTHESWDQMGDREVACVLESLFDLRVGDCINVHEQEGLIESVQRLSCSKPHDGEVIDVLTIPGAAFPGDDAINEYAWLNCPEDTDRYLTPTRDTWESVGDRDIQCIKES